MPGLAQRRIGKTAGLALAMAAVTSSGCPRRDEGNPPPVPPEANESSEASRSSDARALATPTAFELAAAPGGAVLAWAPPDDGALRLQRFGSDGRPASGSGAVVRVAGAGAGVADLVLSATAAGVSLAWSEAAAPPARGGTLRAAWVGPEQVRTFELGAAFRGDDSRRGALALASRDSGALLLARGLPAPCGDARERDCSSFRFIEIGPDAARATGLGLTVPGPCAAHSAQLVSARRSAAGEAGPFEYAICAESAGAMALTVFSIQPSPAYAAAEEALAGCAPLGAGRFGGEATFVGVCGGRRHGVSVPAEGGALVVRDLERRGLVCSAGGAVLRFGNDWLRPNEPLDHLELLLDDDLAPPGARAVWTGAAVLVAQARAGRLSLSRHGCRGSQRVELDAVWDAGSSPEL